MSPSTEEKIGEFLEGHVTAVRVMFGVLGLAFVLAAPVAWDLSSWAVGFAFVLTGIRLLLLAVQGGR